LKNSAAKPGFEVSGTTASGIPLQIKAGTVRVVDTAVSQETVVVTSLDAKGNPIADFKFPHVGHNPTQPSDAVQANPWRAYNRLLHKANVRNRLRVNSKRAKPWRAYTRKRLSIRAPTPWPANETTPGDRRRAFLCGEELVPN
jgi:hypothetical protein